MTVSPTAPGATATPLAGRTALVSGASRGIGLAIAHAFVAAGARTFMLARRQAALRAAAESLGPLAVALPCDVGDAAQVAAVVQQVQEHTPAPDILVNNAGLFPLAPVEETAVGLFTDAVLVNLVAPFQLVRAFLPAMRARGSGDCVLIGSVADRNVFAANAAYAATKFGARAMHEVLRLETRGSGVRVALVSPSATDTALWDDIDPDTREGFPKRADMLDPHAVAEAVLWTVLRPLHVNIDELRLSRS